ncbi:MAG: hypothetical protein HC851_18650 [Acaryochloris sp. RU_4_1]|nr:hypothetical protein [Acaryochloris sp. RU_4_1]NJR56605.1 hypothetical protein [Acaryochloris sp. CRU_2_0]
MRGNIFDKVVTNPPKISSNQIWMGLLLLMFGFGAISLVFLNLRLSAFEGKLEQVATRPIAVQVGKDAELVKSEPVSPEQNVEEFVKEVLPPMFAWSKRVLPEVDPSGIDPGRDTKHGKLPTLIFYYTNALEPRYRNIFREAIANYKPKRFEQGEATLLRIERIVQPRKTEDGWEVEVYADLITLDANDTPYLSEPFNNTIYIQEMLAPKRSASLTPLEEAFVAVQNRGLTITRISKLED